MQPEGGNEMEGGNAMGAVAMVGYLALLCFSVLFSGLGCLMGGLLGKGFRCPRCGMVAGVAGSLLGAWLGYAINGLTYVPPPPQWWIHRSHPAPQRFTPHDKYELADMCIGAFAGGILLPLVVGFAKRRSLIARQPVKNGDLKEHRQGE